MQVIYARQPLPALRPALFLAGPSPRSRSVPSWRPAALDVLRELSFGGAVIVPEPEDWSLAGGYQDEQVVWEWEGLEKADIIVFWVPRDLVTLPGFTTNVEFGFHCRSGKAVLGFPPRAPKMRYLELLARAHGVPVVNDLRALLELTLARLPDDACHGRERP